MSDPTQLPPTAVPYAARVGIDWANKKHHWSMQADDKASVERGVVESSPEAMDAFVSELAKRFPGQKIAVALEQSRGSVLFQLTKYEHLVLHPVHPNTLDYYRKSFYPSGAKSDPCDADLILDLLSKHPDQLRVFVPDDVATRTLQFLVEARRNAVNEKTRHGNELTSQLKMFYPQLLQWFDAVDCPLVWDWLIEWPTLEQVQKEKPAKVLAFLKEHRYASRRSEELLLRLPEAIAATNDQAVIESGILTVKLLLEQLKVLRAGIAAYDKKIKQLTDAHPDKEIFASLPSAGPVMVARLIALWGTRRERYETAGAMQCFSGIAPVVASSGNQEWIHWRWACPKFQRQTMHEWAWLSVRKSEWAKAYYDKQKERKKSHHAAVRALAFKWIRVIYRCWKDRCPYDEGRYVAGLQERGEGKGKATAQPGAVEIQWKKTAGFSKPSRISI